MQFHKIFSGIEKILVNTHKINKPTKKAITNVDSTIKSQPLF